MKEKKWWHLNLFGLEIKPIYGVIIGFLLMTFLQGGILQPLGSILFIASIIALIAEMISKNKKKVK